MLSIIMPVYNTADYLEPTVNSVLAQTYRDFELILVDDGSTDGSDKLCDRLAQRDSRIRVIHKENGGVASARNVGLSAVKGDFIGWVDSDDLISPIMYQTMMELAHKHGADIVQCSHVRSTAELVTELAALPEAEVLNSIDSLKRIYRSHYTNALSLCTKLSRRCVFDGIRFTEGTAFEDDEMVPRFVERGRVNAFIEVPLYCYVKRESSIITAPKVKNIMALTSHLENRMLHFRELDEGLYGLSRDHFFDYLKRKLCQKDFFDTPVQSQAAEMLKKYRRAFARGANRYDRLSLQLLRCGPWGQRLVINKQFAPVQSLLASVKHLLGR